MDRIHVSNFHGACLQVVKECPDQYAKQYARAGIGMVDAETIRVQCLYILGNMSHWRGPTATSARNTFKRIGGVK